jgi:NADH dehydrogenase FAD-containing subunit
VVGIDTSSRAFQLQRGARLAYDVASLNVGSRMAPIRGAEYAVPAKPFEELVERIRPEASTAVIGGGAAGAELAMALRHTGSQVTLYSAAMQFEGAMERRVSQALRRRGVNLIQLGVDQVLPGGLVLAGKAQAEFEQVVIASGAAPHAWLIQSELEKGEGAFVLVDDMLRSVSHAEVFACGDCASQLGTSYPKSGVYAVRQGELLAQNLHRMIANQLLQPYRPQERALMLLSCGSRYAIARRGAWTAEGRLLWWLKNRIDRRWVSKLNALARGAER